MTRFVLVSLLAPPGPSPVQIAPWVLKHLLFILLFSPPGPLLLHSPLRQLPPPTTAATSHPSCPCSLSCLGRCRRRCRRCVDYYIVLLIEPDVAVADEEKRDGVDKAAPCIG